MEGSFNSALFYDFVASLLEHMNPWPARNSVIVMDNCAIHKVPEVRELIESRYVCHICYQLLLIRRDLGEWNLSSFRRTYWISTQLSCPFLSWKLVFEMCVGHMKRLMQYSYSCMERSCQSVHKTVAPSTPIAGTSDSSSHFSWYCISGSRMYR